jgi:DNA-binding GntR family transcriptional regulator
MQHKNHQVSAILNIIRQRICLAPTNGTFVLKETDLAAEFGLSRTPIRQVLQHLAHSNFVETQPGIGTVAVQLNEADRATHVKVYASIALAAATCAQGRTLPTDAAVNLISVANWAKMSKTLGENEFVHLMAQVIDHMLTIIDDPMLSNAYQDAHWRMLRWRVLQLRQDPEVVWEGFHHNIAAATDAANAGNAAKMLRIASGLRKDSAASTLGRETIDKVLRYQTPPKVKERFRQGGAGLRTAQAR